MKKINIISLVFFILSMVNGQEIQQQGNTVTTTNFNKSKKNESDNKISYNKSFTNPTYYDNSENNNADNNVEKSNSQDVIFRMNTSQIKCNVVKITSLYVEFVEPGSIDIQRLQRKQVQRIEYANGEKEVFFDPAIEFIQEYNWEAVLLTDNPLDVRGLMQIGEVYAVSSPESHSPRSARADVVISLQKKAANMKGTMVLIDKKASTPGYGESPSYFIHGIVYGIKPVDETITNAQ